MIGENISDKTDFEKTVIFLAKKLDGLNYAIRGTSSLVLQDIDMNVDDIDIVCDKETALASNEILKDHLIERVEYVESNKFKSYFGKFKINGICVEIMGEWEIKKANGRWLMANVNNRRQIEVHGTKIWVTTIEEELGMFSAMGRWNAYHKIRSQIPLDKQAPAK